MAWVNRTRDDRSAAGITVSGLRKEFRSFTAVDGVDLSVAGGAVLGLLGPNGAGKSTIVRMIATQLRPTAGAISVAGIDALKSPHEVRARIGMSGQYAAVDERLTGLENLTMVARLSGFGRRTAVDRSRELLDQFGIADAGTRVVASYSGGMRRRLDLAGALVNRPPVVILDEPTAGLDPVGRSELWSAINELVSDGVAVLLTTQYLEEADQLADQVVVISRGAVVARGTPNALKATISAARIRLVAKENLDRDRASDVLSRLAHGAGDIEIDGCEMRFTSVGGSHAMAESISLLGAQGVVVVDAQVHTPTLDEVFVQVTGARDRRGRGLPR